MTVQTSREWITLWLTKIVDAQEVIWRTHFNLPKTFQSSSDMVIRTRQRKVYASIKKCLTENKVNVNGINFLISYDLSQALLKI